MIFKKCNDYFLSPKFLRIIENSFKTKIDFNEINILKLTKNLEIS